MKRRNFLQSLAAIGIGSAIVKPTIAEEVKSTAGVPTVLRDKKTKFIIEGRDLVRVLNNPLYKGIFVIKKNHKILARGKAFKIGTMSREVIEKPTPYGYIEFKPAYEWQQQITLIINLNEYDYAPILLEDEIEFEIFSAQTKVHMLGKGILKDWAGELENKVELTYLSFNPKVTVL